MRKSAGLANPYNFNSNDSFQFEQTRLQLDALGKETYTIVSSFVTDFKAIIDKNQMARSWLEQLYKGVEINESHGSDQLAKFRLGSLRRSHFFFFISSLGIDYFFVIPVSLSISKVYRSRPSHQLDQMEDVLVIAHTLAF